MSGHTHWTQLLSPPLRMILSEPQYQPYLFSLSLPYLVFTTSEGCVWETAPAERETSPRPVVTDGWKKWEGSLFSLSFPPLPIVAIAYTPVSSVPFSWGHLHSLRTCTVCSECLSSKSSIHPSFPRHFAALLWHSCRYCGPDSTKITEFPLPISNNAQGLLCYFQGVFGTFVSGELKHICYLSADTHTQPMSQFEPVQFLTLIIQSLHSCHLLWKPRMCELWIS